MKIPVGIFLILITLYQNVNACKCISDEETLVEYFNAYSSIFTGTVLQVEKDRMFDVAKIEVQNGFKNAEKNDTISIRSLRSSCGLSFKVGQYWLISAYSSGHSLESNSCLSTNRIKADTTYAFFQKYWEISSYTGKKFYRYKNNKVGAIGNLNKGIPQGFWQYFDLNGDIKKEGDYQNGLKHGTWKHYVDDSGWFQYNTDYERLIDEVKESEIGILIPTREEFENFYEQEEKLFAIYEYKNGELDGEVRHYRFGQLVRKIQYKNGRKHGVQINWNFDGTISKKSLYENGRFIQTLK